MQDSLGIEEAKRLVRDCAESSITPPTDTPCKAEVAAQGCPDSSAGSGVLELGASMRGGNVHIASPTYIDTIGGQKGTGFVKIFLLRRVRTANSAS